MTPSSNITAGSRFDSVAAGWDDKPGRAVMAAAIAGAVADAVPLRQDMSALDFGAGTGLLTLALALRVKEVTALDASREMLRVLAEKTRAADIGNIVTLHADIERDPLPAARFDLAVGTMVLHHLSDVPGALRRLHSSLRPGGWIALADLDSEDGSFHGDAQGVHHKGFDRARLRQWLEEAGFAWCSARTAYRLTRAGRDGVERSYPLFLAAARHLNREP
ncbi:MAG: class I SAM-dependent methyltransferase [Kiritimatiellae bacterium]|nr:class I SAM-dependent methyltransferase [Kiritimatiellia bacterium]